MISLILPPSPEGRSYCVSMDYNVAATRENQLLADASFTTRGRDWLS